MAFGVGGLRVPLVEAFGLGKQFYGHVLWEIYTESSLNFIGLKFL